MSSGPDALVVEPPGSAVELHRRDAEIYQDGVCRAELLNGKQTRQVGKAGVARRERVRSPAGCGKSRRGAWQFEAVAIESEQSSMRLDSREQGLGVAAAAERRVDHDDRPAPAAGSRAPRAA